MLITTSDNTPVNIPAEKIVKVTVDEDLNRFGAYAAIALRHGGYYVTKTEYDRINRENNNILLGKA